MNEKHRTADVAVGSAGCGSLRSETLRQPSVQPLVLGIVWVALVALAVAGRAWQPAAHVTPLAAVSLAAGAFFPTTLLAISVPIVSLAIGNLFLPPYGNLLEAVVIYAAFAWPVLLGQASLLGTIGRDTRWRTLLGGCLASSLVFYFATNITFWLTTDMYPKSAAGLLACLTAALPFHRWMPVGDVAWSLGIFGVFQAATTASDAFAARRLAPRRSS